MKKMKVRNCPEYVNSIKDVYKRDRWICKLSWHSKWTMHLHHIIPFETLYDEWKEEEVYKEMRWKRIFDVDNLVTITSELHNKFHSIYWYRPLLKDWKAFKKEIEYIKNRDICVSEELFDYWEGSVPLLITTVWCR